MHAVVDARAYRVWLAEALLSARRRLYEDLQGVDGRHRVGEIRRRQLREMRQLHGALRLRRHCRYRFREEAVEAHSAASSRREDGRPDGAGNLTGQSTPGGI